ncbi:MAG: helix-turn-helix domain-containing protein [Clostridiales Family XIII bacterium]|jgi:DNA-binding XRE family transcriptional regulator|nr:helix-turn-helix domain-containing protein [Clostridiales Family XIII bacterium]
MSNTNKRKATSWTEHEQEMREKGILTPEREAEIQVEVDILQALIEARRENKISQRKLEELTGVNHSTINRMEKGDNSPSVSTLLQVLAPLGKTLKVVPIE